MGYIRVCARAAALLALSAAPSLALGQGYDAIGPSNASSNGNNFLSTSSNMDNAADFWTAAGVGEIAIPAGRRVNAVEAVVGARGPNGLGPISFGAINQWEVHVWSSLAAFSAAPTTGNLFSRVYTAPQNAGFGTPYGVDADGHSTFRVRFTMPGGIPGLVGGQTYYFSIRAKASYSTVGYVGVMESTASGASGAQAGWAYLPPDPPYILFNSLPNPVRKHGGVFAYQVGVGCPADFDGNGTVSIDDIFVYLNAWFAQGPGSDFNNSGATTIDDIFIFLNQWFSGC